MSDGPPSAASPVVSVTTLLDELRRHWLLVVLLVVGGAVAGYGISYLFRPRFRAEALVAPHLESGAASKAMGALSGELGGLASLVGLDVGSNVSRAEAIERLKARGTTRRLIEANKLMPVLFADRWNEATKDWKAGVRVPSVDDAIRLFDREVRVVAEDRHTGLITVAITFRDPDLAAQWAGELVRIVNSEMRASAIEEADRTLEYLGREVAKTQVVEMQQAVYRVVEAQLRAKLLAVVRDDYALKVVDPAMPPDPRRPVFPARALFAALGLLAGGIFAGFVLLGFASRRRPA